MSRLISELTHRTYNMGSKRQEGWEREAQNSGEQRHQEISHLKSHTLTMSLQKDRLETHPPPQSTFFTILLKKSFHSSFWVSLSAMIFPGKATFPTWPPKPVADWESSAVQSPSSAILSSWPHTKLSSAVWWSTAPPYGVVLLPHT